MVEACETHPPPQFHSFGTFIVNLPASRQSMPVFNGSTESRKSRSQTRAKVCQYVDQQKRTENEHNSSDFSPHFLHRYLELKLALFVYNMIWHKFPPTKTEYCQRQRYSHDPTEYCHYSPTQRGIRNDLVHMNRAVRWITCYRSCSSISTSRRPSRTRKAFSLVGNKHRGLWLAGDNFDLFSLAGSWKSAVLNTQTTTL